jgi:macrodomain Ter protein organizer (MatP/YcbG family)
MKRKIFARQFNMLLSEVLFARLQTLARHRGISMSATVREMINDSYNEYSEKIATRAAAKRAKT